MKTVLSAMHNLVKRHIWRGVSGNSPWWRAALAALGLLLAGMPAWANQAPTISLSVPAGTAVGLADIPVSIQAADSDGQIVRIDLYRHGARIARLIPPVPGSVYNTTWTWTGVAPGNYRLTAVAVDDQGARTSSAPVDLDVAEPVSVSLTSPASHSKILPGTSLSLSATAATARLGAGIAGVTYYDGSTAIGSAQTAPYSLSYTPAAGRRYLTAVATDSQGLTAVTAPVEILVNAPPAVSVASPVNGSAVMGPADVVLAVNLSDPDNAIAKVQYYQGNTLIATATQAPWQATWNQAPPGNYQIKARAVDALGGATMSAAVSLLIGNPISLAITAPANGQHYIAPAAIELMAVASAPSGIQQIEYKSGNSLIGVASGSAPYRINWNPAGTGSHSVTATAIDQQGNRLTSAPITVHIDAANGLALSQPAAGAYPAPGNLSLVASVPMAISSISFTANRQTIATLNSPPWQHDWANIAAGHYRLSATVIDSNGQRHTTAPVDIDVGQNTPPSVSLDPLANNLVAAGGSISLTASASDADGSIDRVEYYAGALHIGSAQTAPYQLTWANLPAGSYLLTARAIDNRQQATDTAPVLLTVNALPTVAITTPGGNAGTAPLASLDLTASASDTDGSVASVQYRLNGQLLADAILQNGQWRHTWANPPAGTHRITARATDNRGMSRDSAPVTFVINSPPTVSLTSPANGASLTAPAALDLAADANDADDGIAYVAYRRGNRLIGSVTGANPYLYAWGPQAPGQYTLSVTAVDRADNQTSSAPVQLTIQAANQNLQLTPLPGLGYGNAPVSVSVTSSAGLPVSLTTASAACQLTNQTLTNGTTSATLSVQAAGDCVIDADQPGDANTQAAEASWTLTIGQATQTIDFNPASVLTQAVGTSFSVTATGGASGNPVVIASTTPGQCQVGNQTGGNNAATTASVLILNLGTCTLTASQAGNGNYQAAAAVTASIVIQSPVQAQQLHYVHPDHLGTPRAITRPSDNALVWKWDSVEPFGNNAANENPSGLGAFAYNLRHPGQYADAETGTFYNWNRDYDSAIGRYRQSDPIGLDGGANTYAYAFSSPLKFIDPDGLQVALPIQPPPPAGGSGGACPTCPKPESDPYGLGLSGGSSSGSGPTLSFPNLTLLSPTQLLLLGGVSLMAAPGRQADTQIEGDYGRAASDAKLNNCPPPDRCKWLEENASRYRPDQVKATQKAWGCRPSRQSKDKIKR